jgi:hypothetical protein
MADQLLVEMRDALDHFTEHPPASPSTLELVGAGSNSHDHSGR